MRYAIAVWNYVQPNTELCDLVREFIAFGYDTISLSSTQFGRNDNPDMQAVAELVRQNDLGVTVHCAFDFGVGGVRRVLDLFGEHLLAITFDAVMQYEPRGSLYDAATMVPIVSEVLALTKGTPVRVGIEDFPLDGSAVDFYRDHMNAVMKKPRYGMLLDVGHLNIRLRGCRYFGGMSVSDYIRRIPVPIVEVHLHDNHGVRDEHGPFGEGNTDFSSIAQALKAVNFVGVSTVEIAPSLHNSTPDADKPHAQAALAKWRALWEA